MSGTRYGVAFSEDHDDGVQDSTDDEDDENED